MYNHNTCWGFRDTSQPPRLYFIALAQPTISFLIYNLEAPINNPIIFIMLM